MVRVDGGGGVNFFNGMDVDVGSVVDVDVGLWSIDPVPGNGKEGGVDVDVDVISPSFIPPGRREIPS